MWSICVHASCYQTTCQHTIHASVCIHTHITWHGFVRMWSQNPHSWTMASVPKVRYVLPASWEWHARALPNASVGSVCTVSTIHCLYFTQKGSRKGMHRYAHKSSLYVSYLGRSKVLGWLWGTGQVYVPQTCSTEGRGGVQTSIEAKQAMKCVIAAQI